jgi:hypothetical protein
MNPEGRHYTCTELLRKYEKRHLHVQLGTFPEYSAIGKEAVASVRAVRYMGAPKQSALRAARRLLVRRLSLALDHFSS